MASATLLGIDALSSEGFSRLAEALGLEPGTLALGAPPRSGS